MAALSRSAAAVPLAVGPRCCRLFASSPGLLSGHNKWSKIRHGKGIADAKKTSVRAGFSKSLALYSKLYGSDLKANPQLAACVALARKAAVPKATIEAAIARGQGRSADGAVLESVTFEVMMPPAVALIVDVETDSRLRVLQELNHLVKNHGGSATPTRFLFARRGRVVFAPGGAGAGSDDVLDHAIEAGAEDLDTDGAGNLVVWTRPSLTGQVANEVGAKFALGLLSAGLVWTPHADTRAPVGAPHQLQKLTELVSAFRDCDDVQAIYSNALRGDADQGAWDKLEQHIDV